MKVWITVKCKRKDWLVGKTFTAKVEPVPGHPTVGKRIGEGTMRVRPASNFVLKEPGNTRQMGYVGGARRIFTWWPTIGWRHTMEV